MNIKLNVIKYFLLLILYLFLLSVLFFLSEWFNFSFISISLSLIIFFAISYVVAINQIINNCELIIKIKAKSFYIIPYFTFIIPVIIIFLFFIQKNILNISIYFIFLFSSSILFFLIIHLLKKEIKVILFKDDKINITNNKNKEKKLLLINPVDRTLKGFPDNPASCFPPIGLGILAALTPDDFEIILIDENFEIFNYQDADLVAITAFTISVNRAYKIASYYTKKNIPVIMGGIHVSMCPDEALKIADCIVTGEAESVWPQVIKDFKNGKLQKIYKGKHLDLKNAVIPKREIFSKKYLHATVQTSRGCPMDCKFCTVSLFNDRIHRQRPINEVLDEIESIREKYIFFVDDNLIGYGNKSKERAINLFKGMIDRKLNKKWYCQTSLNFFMDDEVLKWASKSGCTMAYIGVESPDPDELKTLNKSHNIPMDYKKIFKKINKHGISVFGCFMFGIENETYESLNYKVNFIIKNRIDIMEITVCTPFPGTKLFNEYSKSNNLFYTGFPKDWQKYDMQTLIYPMKKMDNDIFHKLIKKLGKKIYSNCNIFFKSLKAGINTKSLESVFRTSGINFTCKNILIGKKKS